jgi:cellulose synthase/poly-beta-1,6-N-acetylglucosamine synthase-like glycosyltransferase
MTLSALIFWLALLLTAYAYVGYPALLWLWSKLRPRPHHPGPTNLSVSIVIAARNEEAVIARRVNEFSTLAANASINAEMIIVSDGSTDATADRVQNCSAPDAKVPIRLVVLEKNLGKAAALTAGCQAARHDIIVLADARQTWAPDALTRLLENFADENVGGVSGELVLESAPGVAGGIGLYWRYEKLIRQLESGVGSVVGVSGSICAVRRELFTPIPRGTVLDDVYWPMRVVMQNKRVVLDRRAKAFDQLPAKPKAEFKRKVRTLAGNFQLATRLPRLLVPWRNPLWLQFVSHKLARLAVPWALIAMLACAAVQPGLFWRGVLIAQLCGYLLAASAIIAPNKIRPRIASAAASFLLLNAAAAVAFWVWVTGRTARSWNQTAYQATPRPTSAPVPA